MTTSRSDSRSGERVSGLCDGLASRGNGRSTRDSVKLDVSFEEGEITVVVEVLYVDVTVTVGGVVVVVNGLVVVVVIVAKAVVDVTIVEVETAETKTGSCVIVTTAKNPAPGGLTKSD
jgi:hypothetical protein